MSSPDSEPEHGEEPVIYAWLDEVSGFGPPDGSEDLEAARREVRQRLGRMVPAPVMRVRGMRIMLQSPTLDEFVRRSRELAYSEQGEAEAAAEMYRAAVPPLEAPPAGSGGAGG